MLTFFNYLTIARCLQRRGIPRQVISANLKRLKKCEISLEKQGGLKTRYEAQKQQSAKVGKR